MIVNMSVNNRVSVKCQDCKKVYTKRKDSLKNWSGICGNCSRREIANRPSVRKAHSIAAKRQIAKLWQYPPYRRMMSKSHVGMKGHEHPSWKGGKPKCLDCGKQLPWYNAKRCHPCYAKTRIRHDVSLKTRQKISNAQKGDKSHNWRGGRSKIRDRIYHSLEYRVWREAVFERDNYTCQHCNKKHGYLQPHHIKSFSEYPKLLFIVSNGLTLCLKCHRKTDNFGFRQSNKNMQKS